MSKFQERDRESKGWRQRECLLCERETERERQSMREKEAEERERARARSLSFSQEGARQREARDKRRAWVLKMY